MVYNAANRYIKCVCYFHITLRFVLNLNVLIMSVLALLLVSQKTINYDCLHVVLRLNSTLNFPWTPRVWKTHPRLSTGLPACP